jgi:hypothetical protein
MTKRHIRVLHWAILILLAGSVVVLNARWVEGSSISNPDAVAWELAGKDKDSPPEGWIDRWMWHQEAPFRYRVLGKLPVWAAWNLVGKAGGSGSFYIIYLIWSFLCLGAAVIALYSFLRLLLRDLEGEGGKLSLFGCLLFLSAPPVLFAYKFPLHTSPNDFLGYFLTVLGVSMVIRERPGRMSLVSCLAALCRETTLVVPLVYLLFSRDSWRRRMVLSLLPVAVLAAVRVVWWSAYRPLEGLSYNLAYPIEAFAFLFLLFGPLWVPALAGLREPILRTDAHRRDLAGTLPCVSILLVVFTVLFGRIREIRILFILFIYAIPLALVRLAGCRERIRRLTRSFRYWLYVLVAAVFVLLLHANAPAASIEEGIAIFGKLRHFYGGYGRGWVNETAIYLFAALAVIPLVARRRPGPRLDAAPSR